jgi:hypothetical protein
MELRLRYLEQKSIAVIEERLLEAPREQPHIREAYSCFASNVTPDQIPEVLSMTGDLRKAA